MVKRLYLVRHGQTQFNALKIVQGSCDAKLTPLGLQQAAQAGLYLQRTGITFSEVFCSQALRARQTLETMLPEQTYTYLATLKEWDFGLFEGENEVLQDPRIFHNLPKDIYALFDGESYNDFANRIKSTIDKIVMDAMGNILIVAHGCVNFAFYDLCQRKEDTKVVFSNCAIQVYRCEGNDYIYERSIVPSEELMAE